MQEPQPRQAPEWLKTADAFFTSAKFLTVLFTLGMIGLIYARALLSIYSGAFVVIAVIHFMANRDAFREIPQYKGLWALSGVLLVYIISGIHSDNVGKWAQFLNENITYLVIPLGYFVMRKQTARTWRNLLVIFVGVMSISALIVTVDYLLHFEAYNKLYQVGKTIPTPIIHVRYSFFMALASCIAFALALDRSNFSIKRGIAVRFMLAAGVFLAVFVHVLAVRTGIVALYGGILVMLVCAVVREGRWRLGLVSLAMMAIISIVAIKAFPSVGNKIGYVMYDLDMLRKHGALANYSDNIRLTSLQHGLSLFNKQPITGTGIGDLESEVSKQYSIHTPDFPKEHHYPPINQYLFVLTAFGVTGALLYFASLLYPLFATPFNYILTGIYATTLFSLLGETTIQLQLGRTTFVSLVCITVLYMLSEKGHTESQSAS